MAESLVSIVIADNRVSAAKFSVDKRDLKIGAGDSASFEKIGDLAKSLATVIENCAASSMVCRLALGPEFFFFRSIELPFSDKKQIASILSFEVQDSVSLSEDEYIFDYLYVDTDGEGTRVLAVLLKKEVIRDLLAVLGEYELDPEVITISGVPGCHNFYRLTENRFETCYLLNVGIRYAAVYLLNRGNLTLVRSIPVDPGRKADFYLTQNTNKLVARNPENVNDVLLDIGRNVQNTVVALRGDTSDTIDIPWVVGGLVGSVPEIKGELQKQLALGDSFQDWLCYSKIEGVGPFLKFRPPGLFDEVLAVACCPNRDLQQLNFRKDEFSRRYDRKRLHKIVRSGVAALLVAVLLIISGLIIDYQHMKTERDRVASQVAEIYRETIPGSGRLVNPVQQLQVKVNELKNATSTGASDDPTLNTLVLLGDISDRIPETLKVTFQRYIYDRKTIRIKGLTDNFNTVDQMKRSLDKSPYFTEVAIVSANVASKDDGVRFELKLQM